MVSPFTASVLALCTAAMLLAGCATAHHRSKVTPAMCPESPPAWTARDGRQLAYRTWPARRALRAVVVAVPGWDGTMCDIESLGQYLAPRGIQVVSLSVRGQHGDLTARALGTKGEIDTWRHWPEDLIAFTADLRRRYPGIPIFWHGHSLGAPIVLEASEMVGPAEAPPLILHAPAVAITHAPLWERSLIHCLASVAPKIRFRSGFNLPPPPALSNNAALDLAWRTSADRVRPGFTFHFVSNVFHLGSHARDAAHHLRQPVLVLVGLRDPIAPTGVGLRGYRKLVRSIPAPVEVRIFRKGVHDLYHDLNAPPAFREISEWIDQTLATRRGSPGQSVQREGGSGAVIAARRH